MIIFLLIVIISELFFIGLCLVEIISNTKRKET